MHDGGGNDDDLCRYVVLLCVWVCVNAMPKARAKAPQCQKDMISVRNGQIERVLSYPNSELFAETLSRQKALVL